MTAQAHFMRHRYSGFDKPFRIVAADVASTERLTEALTRPQRGPGLYSESWQGYPLLAASVALFVAGVLGAGLALGGAAARRRARRKTTTVREIAQALPAASTVRRRSRSTTSTAARRRRRPGHLDHVVTVPADPFFGGRLPRAAAAAVARLRLRGRQGRPRRHELPRRPGRAAGPRQLLERRQHEGDRRRHRPVQRPRRPEDRRAARAR